MVIDSATQQTILFFVQITSLIFLIVYVIKTWEMASATRKAAEATEKSVIEMRDTRDQETAPFVIAYFDVQTESSLIYLVVKNIGRTVANQVILTFTPALRSSNDNRVLGETGFIKNGIESMPPNYEIRTLVDSSVGYLGKNELPMKYDVEITYYGGIESKKRVTNQQLDLSAYKGISYVRNKTMNNLVDEVEKLVRESREIKNATSDIAATLGHGIYISNASLSVTKLELDMENWKKYLIAKINEFESLWSVFYRNKREQGIGLSKLQAHALTIGEQILLLNSNKVDNISTGILEKTALIAGKLQELGQMTFYIDGGASLEKFNEIGDSIITDINDFKTKNA
jgi:hypothetical protein